MRSKAEDIHLLGEVVDRLVDFMSEAETAKFDAKKKRAEICLIMNEWERDHKRLLETNLRLSAVNAESADLLAKLEFSNQALTDLNRKLAEANANSANMMVEIEEKNEILDRKNKELARANAHAADLMAIIENKEEDIQKLNKSLSKANARSADLLADLELNVQEINNLNISLTKEIEAKEKIEQNLRKSNATKDRFFSIIAHDLRHPFNSISNFITLLNEYADNLSKADILRVTKDLKEDSDKTRDLLENLLEWAQAQRGTISFKPGVLDLPEVSDEVISQIMPVAKDKKIELESHIPAKCQVYADTHMVSTILRNLVSNAIKFTPEDGKITVNAADKQGLVYIQVNDTGVGMTQETVEKLFRIDKKVSFKGTANEKGTGLGLILCKELVEKNGGQISVTSAPDKGSSFEFSLPEADKSHL